MSETVNDVANMFVTRPGTTANGSRFFRNFAHIETAYFCLVNVCLVGALIADRHKQCAIHNNLREWCIVQIVLQSLMAVSNLAISKIMPRANVENETANPRMYSVAGLYSASRLLNLFWFIWAICGVVWTFTAKSCSQSTPYIYKALLSLTIWHSVLFCLPVLLCCCSVPIVFLIYNFCPGRFGIKIPRRASKRTINSNTTAKKFKPELLSKDRATCAICLCDYSENEDIRFLRCGHHFHDSCIVTWLMKNKTCPFCKQDIEDKDAKVLLQPQPTFAQLPPNLA